MVIILNGINYSTSKNGNYIINFTGKKVFDEIRGYLVSINQKWVFIGIEQIQQFASIQKKKIALILESPHKDEFDLNGNPLRPANGRTGENIKNKIITRNWVSSMTASRLNSNFAYEVLLINPIQYQASCYCVLGKSFSRDNTNQVFRKLFSKKGFNLRQDFIDRLHNYDPDLVINCCTSSGNLKKTVGNAIIDAGYNFTNDSHPSRW